MYIYLSHSQIIFRLSSVNIQLIAKILRTSSLEISTLINIASLTSFFINFKSKPFWFMFLLSSFHLSPSSSLLLFQSMLLITSQIFITKFKSSLIRSKSRICNWKQANHLLIKIIQLSSKLA